ncbi:MAG: hypothetical protein M9916_06970 [Crocinitomicaceae bacterium]|nr:hypothetical protein [Crocinitomicaceae bacterium]HRO75663.1 hypothetical protein [Crocinitomicaceae bacterium]
MKFFVFTVMLMASMSLAKAQTSNTVSVDSTKFRLIQNEMVGCWNTKYYQFKYEKERNFGYEYKSRIHSSAPFFILKIIDNEIFIEWVELTGGSNLQKIVSIKKNKLTVENVNGKRVVYKRNIGCIVSVDSTKFKIIQNEMVGCWKTKSHQFEYNKERNFGSEYGRVYINSFPFFSLEIIGTRIFIKWVEGSYGTREILNIKKNKLTIENFLGKRVVYKRDRSCLGQ